MRVVPRALEAWKAPASVLVIGEIPVEMVTWEWDGDQHWIGRFPDGKRCCTDEARGNHGSREEAVTCSRQRVADGVAFEVVHDPPFGAPAGAGSVKGRDAGRTVRKTSDDASCGRQQA